MRLEDRGAPLHHFTSRRGGFHRPDGMKDRSLPFQEPQLAGPATAWLRDLTGLPHERPGACQVGERKVDASQLDPGLNGDVGKREGGSCAASTRRR